MKNPDLKVYVDDMKKAICTILEEVGTMSLSEFKKNRTLQLAVERLFEILGEAANRIPKDFQLNYPQIPWSKIIGMRNIIIHSYDKIDSEQLYLTIKENLPVLKSELEKI